MGIVLRSVAVYLFLWVALRGTGKRQLTQLTVFELVVVIVMGDLIQQGVTLEDMSVTGAMLAITPMILLSVAASAAATRWRRAGAVLEGVPVVVIHRGQVVSDAMRTERLDVADLYEAARTEGISDLRDVEWCVLEADGHLSFLRTASEDR
jgi:uncharacterized membrane protein YcaP (DUF421 family)